MLLPARDVMLGGDGEGSPAETRLLPGPAGILAVMNTLSEAPSKAGQYSRQGWDFVKERLK